MTLSYKLIQVLKKYIPHHHQQQQLGVLLDLMAIAARKKGSNCAFGTFWENFLVQIEVENVLKAVLPRSPPTTAATAAKRNETQTHKRAHAHTNNFSYNGSKTSKSAAATITSSSNNNDSSNNKSSSNSITDITMTLSYEII